TASWPFAKYTRQEKQLKKDPSRRSIKKRCRCHFKSQSYQRRFAKSNLMQKIQEESASDWNTTKQ
ncbi:hypothetical protein Ocin01_16153, partial [Orchesella cincta]